MALVSLCITAVLSILGQPATGGFGSARVAVVDIPAVSQRYLRTADLEAQFEQHRIKFTEQRDVLRQKIERTARSLQEEFKPGSEEFEVRRKQLVLLEAELQWYVETEGQKLEAPLAASLRQIYSDIRVAVRDVAKERDIDIVIAADRLPEDTPRTTAQARQQILLQKVVYWTLRVDITEEVLRRLNADHKARRMTAPSGPARPPLSEEDPVGGDSIGGLRNPGSP